MEKINLAQKATLREQVLGGVAILGLLVIFVRVIYLPHRVTQKKVDQEISNLMMEKEAIQKFTTALSLTLAEAEPSPERKSRSAKMQILKGTVEPVAEEMAPLLAELTARSRLKGITIIKMNDLPPKQEKGYTTSGYFINIRGRFRDIVNYLERVQQIPALFSVETVTLKTIDPQVASVDLEFGGVLFKRESRKNDRN